EPEMASRAAGRINSERIKDLQQILEEFRIAVSQHSKLGQLSASDRFYDVIFTAAGNGIIKDILEGLNARISVLRGRSMSHPGRATHSLLELEAIAAAISRQDADAARSAARVHIRNACASAC